MQKIATRVCSMYVSFSKNSLVEKTRELRLLFGQKTNDLEKSVPN